MSKREGAFLGSGTRFPAGRAGRARRCRPRRSRRSRCHFHDIGGVSQIPGREVGEPRCQPPPGRIWLFWGMQLAGAVQVSGTSETATQMGHFRAVASTNARLPRRSGPLECIPRWLLLVLRHCAGGLSSQLGLNCLQALQRRRRLQQAADPSCRACVVASHVDRGYVLAEQVVRIRAARRARIGSAPGDSVPACRSWRIRQARPAVDPATKACPG